LILRVQNPFNFIFYKNDFIKKNKKTQMQIRVGFKVIFDENKALNIMIKQTIII